MAKHKGLTMFVVPMDAVGVTIRPLRQVSGSAHFNEVFFDDVALDEDATVGAVDGGWGVAMTTLLFERVAIGLGGEGFGWRADRFAQALLADEASTRDAEVRHRFGELASEFLALRFTGYRTLTALERGRAPGPEGALAKVTTIRAAGGALDAASRTQISGHGGIGATWEHDAPLYFRRAQLSRRLLGGAADGADRVAVELPEAARAAA